MLQKLVRLLQNIHVQDFIVYKFNILKQGVQARRFFSYIHHLPHFMYFLWVCCLLKHAEQLLLFMLNQQCSGKVTGTRKQWK